MARWALTAVLAAGALLAPGAAFACAGFTECPELIPHDGTKVPANLPAVWVGGSCASEQGPELSGPDGPVAFDPEPWGNGVLLRLSAPLREGATYTLRSNMDAGTSLPCYCDGVPTAVSVFEAGPPSPLPTQLHARAADATRMTMRVPTRSGSCDSEEDVVAVALSLHPSPELLAFAPLLRTRVIMGNDEIWCGTEWRGCQGVTVAAACPLPHDDGAEVLRPGQYRIRVEGGVIGAPDLAPSTIDVRLCCEEAECPDRRVLLEELTAWKDLVRKTPLPFGPDDGTPPQEVGGTGGDASGGDGGDGGGGAGAEVLAGNGGATTRASAGHPSAERGGCGCSSGGSSELVLLVPLLWRKRGRQVSKQAADPG